MCLSVCGVVCVCVCVLVYVYMMYICVMFLSACTMCGCVHMYTCVQCLCMHVHCAWCVSLVCVVCLIEMYNIPKTIDIALFFQYWYCVLNFESQYFINIYCVLYSHYFATIFWYYLCLVCLSFLHLTILRSVYQFSRLVIASIIINITQIIQREC